MSTDRWTDDYLNSMRRTGDKEADAVIMAVMQEHGLQKVNDVFVHLVKNDSYVEAELPSIVQQYLKDTAVLPEWADQRTLKVASDVFFVHGAEIVLLLFGASLPVLYANPKGARVLTMTNFMVNRLLRRIVETAQFVLDVTDTDAFGPNGMGIRTTQKVRLMHATIRHLIQYEPRWAKDWNTEWGLPINQTDLTGTMMSFSTTVIAGLKNSSINLSQEHQEAYLHLWKVVGHLLGIVPELMPENVADATLYMEHWSRLYQERSDSGIALAKALVDLMKSYVLFRPLKGIPTSWIRFSTSNHVGDVLAIAPFDWTVGLLRAEAVAWALLDRLSYSSVRWERLSRVISRQVLVGLLAFERGGSRPAFRLPDRLRQSMNIPASAVAAPLSPALAATQTGGEGD